MLVLTRRVGERLVIDLGTGSPIAVTVLGMKDNKVRLGIDAPAHIPVHREEIYQRIQHGARSPRKVVGG